MKTAGIQKFVEILQNDEAVLLEDWIAEQLTATTLRPDLLDESELRYQSREFLVAVRQAVQTGNISDITTPEWEEARDLLRSVSSLRATQGFTPSETATFVLSLKQPLFSQMEAAMEESNWQDMMETVWAITVLMDKLGLYSVDAFLQTREETISRQHEDLIELSTPVIQLWDSILAVPLIGTLDSVRTQRVMESLLEKIVVTGADIAIVDITGVPTVDTLVAQHLLKTVAAARLMGAECIISGIRPHIAQTIVQLGAEFTGIRTKATLAGALALALKDLNLTIK